jgi:hypothetical protein
VALVTVNITSGFVIVERILWMFRKRRGTK